jgi:3-isopropylmalate/(R)-2-methylmalate dehydratase small subunit
MDAFTSFRAVAIPVDIANCDTDQIVPGRFLRYTRNSPGFERYLFHDLRFDADGKEKPEFIYNREPYRRGGIVVADVNWGCGSSREQAVYVLVANGIRAVLAPSFGDIHYSNCTKQGVLPVRLERTDCDRLRRQLHETPGAEIAIDLKAQQVTGPDRRVYGFEIDPFLKYRLLNGLDDVDVTLEYESELAAFEARHAAAYDWLD